MKPSPSRLPAAAPRAERAASIPAAVDYRLARAATLRSWKKGQIGRDEVCDAQRELRRNAEFCGQPTGRVCPVCDREGVVEVTYVFGSRLPKHGRCITTRAEIQRLQQRVNPVTGYVVEVCTGCAWNHLVRQFTLGGRRSA